MNNATLPPGTRQLPPHPLPSTLSTPTLGNGLIGFLRRLSTPELLRLLLATITGGVLLFWLSAWSGAGSIRTSQEFLRRDTTPNIIAARHISTALSEIDATTVKLLMLPLQHATDLQSLRDLEGFTPPRGETRSVFMQRLRRESEETIQRTRTQLSAARQEQRRAFSDALVAAAANTAYSRWESSDHDSITTIESGMQRYEALCAQALLFASQHKDAEARATYRQAYAILESNLLPATHALIQRNTDALQYSGMAGVEFDSGPSSLFDGTVLLLLSALIGTQVLLAMRTRRVFNLYLVAATLLVFGMRTWAANIQADSSQRLVVARLDNFEPARLLLAARDCAATAHAIQERAYYMPDRATFYRGAFDGQIAHAAQALSYYSTALNDANARLNQNSDDGVQYLGDQQWAVANTANGPGPLNSAWEDADAAHRSLSSALQQWAKISAEKAGTPHRGDPESAYEQFDSALDYTFVDHQSAFRQSIESSSGNLIDYETLLTFGCCSIVLLTCIGIWPRLKEYAF